MKPPKPFDPANFERPFVAFISLVCAILLIYLGVQGPLFQNNIVYKTHPSVNNQLIAQDAVNTFLIAPLMLIAAWGLYARKRFAKYLLALTPLFLLYYAISYMVGWEWMAADYSGNSQLWFFHYLGVMIAAVIILFYTLSALKARQKPHFGKRSLLIYSICFTVFMALFGMMWMKEIFEVFATGTARGYDLSPTAFWLVRCFDLGFSIPLGFISLYLLWLRPQTTFPVQMLLYGFFLSMSVVVNAMGWVMVINQDPAADPMGNIVFVILMLISLFGYFYILRGYGKKKGSLSN